MAVDTLRPGVLAAGDREIGVVEITLEPIHIRPAVAQLAVGRETGARVVRVRCAVVVVKVTVHAVGRETVVHAARVARRTIEGRVDSDQRICVTEGRARPGRRLVARLTIGWEPCRSVVGIGRRIVVVEVAIDALGRKPGVHAPRVKRAALLGNVRADQRPHRVRIGGLEPVRIGLLMTAVARRREPCRRMIRIRSGVVIIQMTVHAVGRQACVHPARVAR